MKKLIVTLFLASSLLSASAQNQKLIDSLPVSEIDIPLQIALKPFYALAEKNVDTVFTSPNFPNDWIQADCATRYKYRFSRSPLRMSMNGNTLNLSFTGLYGIVGSTRACVNGTVLSPWTPECSCGFKEAKRRVDIGFAASFKLQPNYLLQTKMSRTEPRALDKCSVCFWGQDITQTVLDGLKKELDASKKAMEDSFSNINLRPYLQQAWNKLNEVYAIPGIGYLSLHPKKLRMQNMIARNDMLTVNIGISATPTIAFEKPDGSTSLVPNLSASANKDGFNIYLEAALQYDSLSNVANAYLKGKRFDLSEGLIKKHIVVEKTTISGDATGLMNIRLDFSGSFSGTAFFKGKPEYDAQKKLVQVAHLDYDLQSKSILLKTAKWLFDKKITNELKKATTISLVNYYDTAAKTLNNYLNKEWTKGIRGKGSVTELKLTAVEALPQHLLIRSNCAGKLSISVTEINLQF